MTLAPEIVHNEQRIDNLITEAVVDCFSSFEDIFLYVSRNYRLSNSQGFFFVVEKRFKSLKKRGVIAYDRSAKTWIRNEAIQ